jgi:hypothetical protein
MVPMRRRDFLSTLAAAPLFGQADRQRHVVIISIDGFAAYALNDAQLPLPTFRRLAREGAAAEAMEPVNPTVTWPNHTSIITGVTPSRHMVLYNGLAVRGGEGAALKVEPWVDKPELVKAPTLYDAAHSAGLSTAEVDWVAIHNAKTITHAFPEVPRLTDPVVKEMIAAGTVTEENVRTFNKGSIRSIATALPVLRLIRRSLWLMRRCSGCSTRCGGRGSWNARLCSLSPIMVSRRTSM